MAKGVFTFARVLSLGLCLGLGACMLPPPSERATDAARELNLAARFGRIDIAAERASNSAREDFLRSRSGWGGEIRVVDVELTGMTMPDSDHAVFQVDYSWMRASEDILRTTRVSQNWEATNGAWVLAGEKRIGGDVGLLGEHVDVLRPAQRDAQFATKVIRAD